MEDRHITINIDEARKWFYSGNETLKEIALQAFDANELANGFRRITTFKKACEVLGICYDSIIAIDGVNRSASAMFKLSIIRQALNLGKDIQLTAKLSGSAFYYPKNQFATENSTDFNRAVKKGDIEKIGKIKSKGISYNVFGGLSCESYGGLGCFYSCVGVGYSEAHVGFLGCASKEIADHFGKYFGMLITEAKYGSLINDFEIIESKYEN